MQKPALIIVYPKDLMQIFSHLTSYRGAWKRYDTAKKALGKKKHQYLTLKELADYEGLEVDEVKTMLSK